MFREITSMLIFSLVTVTLSAGQLTAEETNISFERKQFTVSRHRGKIFFDGTSAPRDILENKSKEVRLIETFDGLGFSSDKQFLQWAQKLRGTRTYTYDEVTRVNADGSTLVQPLVFFDQEQRTELDMKWHDWLDQRHAAMEEANRIRLEQEQEVKRYQQQSYLLELQSQALSAQIAAAERSADSLAVISGATSLWEVELVPAGSTGLCSSCSSNFGGLTWGTQSTGISFLANGGSLTSTFGSNYNFGTGSNSVYVRAYGRTSQAASDYALNTHPGYRAAGVRRLAGY
jgi:hypothetical protein